MSLDKVKL